jgi:signal transduction histidine kinase
VSERDQRRTDGIAAYDVLGRPARRDLLAVVELAARICDVPMATINLITDLEQHQVAAYGFDAAVCRREDSMCAAILDSDTPVVVTDASLDPRFRDNPFVTGAIGSVRFYASHKLVTPDGVPIGTLCVFDERPRSMAESQIQALGTLAERVVDVLELSLRTRQLAESLAAVETMRDELVASNDRLASFAGQVSHDLKSPLTAVTMSLGMIREQLDQGGEQPDVLWLVERAIGGSTRMAALIDDVLQFAQIGGRLGADDVDLDEVVSEAVADLGPSLTGVTMSIGSLPVVCGDRVQLRAVVQNLIGNAAKFRSPDRQPAVQVSARRRATGWRVEVTDNGRGVPVEDRERVFEPLARVDESVPGSGIGLATCRRVVEAHGGRIGLDEAVGGGTVAWFELPA